MKLQIEFSRLLRQARKQAGLTQLQVAEKTGIGRLRLSRLENGRPPRTDELRSLSWLLGAQLGDTDAGLKLPVHSPLLQRLAPPLPPAPAPQWPNARRLAAASRANYRLYRALWPRVEEDPLWQLFFRDAWMDSGDEVFFWLKAAGMSSRPLRLSPLAQGFRLAAVVCPYTDLQIGDVRVPCVLVETPEPLLLFPQVTLLLGRLKIRLDCLIRVGKHTWVAIEIDGGGHVAAWDKDREDQLSALGIRVFRFTGPQVQAGNVLEAVLAECSGTELRPAA